MGIKERTPKAKENTKNFGSLSSEIDSLLCIPQLNYFQVRQLVELMKKTEAGKTNMIGQYSNQCMQDWWEILKLYEKEGTFMVETANAITRNVNYEVPAVKKQISKCQQTQKECQRKEKEHSASATDLRKQYNTSCKQLGIQGDKIKTELAALVAHLPEELNKFAESAKSLNDAVTFYDEFAQFLIQDEGVGETSLPVLKHLLKFGNTTTFQWKTGREPKEIVNPPINIDLSDEQDVSGEAELDIDWGGGDAGIDFGEQIDFDLGDITLESGGVLAAEGVELENPDTDAIDWGAVEVESSEQQEVTSDTATGADALSIIDNPSTRGLFVDDLMELQAFLRQRVSELGNKSAQTNHMASAPSSLHIDQGQVEAMLCKVQDILDKLTSVQMEHLLLIRDSPRYVERLKDSLKQKLGLADKMVLAEKESAAVRRTAVEEEQALMPVLEELRRSTKALKAQIEDEISKKYDDRKVNITGEINII